MNTAENTVAEGTVKELTPNTVATIELLADSTIDQSIEDMEFEQAVAEERAAILKQAIADAKVQKRKDDLHKIVEVVDNLENQFGEDFVKVIQDKFSFKEIIVLTDSKEIDDYEKFLTLIERGYRVVGDEVMGKRSEPINSNTINSQITNEPKVLMNVPKFKTLYAKYK